MITTNDEEKNKINFFFSYKIHKRNKKEKRNSKPVLPLKATKTKIVAINMYREKLETLSFFDLITPKQMKMKIEYATDVSHIDIAFKPIARLLCFAHSSQYPSIAVLSKNHNLNSLLPSWKRLKMAKINMKVKTLKKICFGVKLYINAFRISGNKRNEIKAKRRRLICMLKKNSSPTFIIK